MRKSISIGIMILLLVACAGSKPTPTASADYGPYPENWYQTTSDLLSSERRVKPKHLRIWTIDPPMKMQIKTPEGEMINGWGICGKLVKTRMVIEPFIILIQFDKPVYEAIGNNMIKRIPGKTWTSEQVPYDRYCSNF